MAMSQQQRDEKRREKADRLGEQDLRLRVHASHASQLADLMSWDEIEESGEALTLMIYQAHKIGRERFLWFMAGAQLQIESGKVQPIDRSEIRLMARRGTVDALDEMGSWIEAPDRSFTVRLLIERTHALGPIQALMLLRHPPRHKFELTDSVARSLDRFRLSRELRVPDILLGEDPDDTGLILLADLRRA